MKKHSVVLSGHATSLSLEPVFWRRLQELAAIRGVGAQELIARIDRARTGNLSSAVRVYILEHAAEIRQQEQPQQDSVDGEKGE